MQSAVVCACFQISDLSVFNFWFHSSFISSSFNFSFIGISSFPMKVKNASNEGHTVEITVNEYFAKYCGIELTFSAYLPCLDVGKPKRPNYLPLEVCKSLVLDTQMIFS